jgi:predicted ATPase
VRSLSLPTNGESISQAELAGFDAIHLFVSRAETVKQNFTLTDDNAITILHICRRLDGIPLAIELAAARTRLLSPQQILDRLDDRFRLLTGGSRTALPRQRTLQALIDWSYDLLSEEECVLLRRVSVFSGGWTLEAAESVAGVDPLESYEILDLLELLHNKSLITVEEGDLGMRYRMLETIRQYAQAKLAQNGDADQIRDRHLAYFVGLHEQATAAIMGLHGGDWVARLAADVDNLRAAQAWALENDITSALRLMAGITFHWTSIIPAAEELLYLE